MRAAVIAAVLTTLAWAAPASAQKKIQCWTDKNGQRMCGDRVPPEYAGKKREVMKDGRVVDTVEGKKSSEQLAEQQRLRAKEEDAKRRADYDRALLETYRTPKDIESMRDERLALIDGRLAVIQKNTATTEKTLVDLRARAEAWSKDGKPVPDKLAQQIKQAERDQKKNKRTLERTQNERSEVESKFNADLDRYYELRGGRPPEQPAATPATPATPADPGTAPATPATPATPAKQ